MDEKVKQSINKAIALTPVMNNFRGFLSLVRKAEQLKAEEKNLTELVGKEKAEDVIDKIKFEAYQQHRDNGQYILERLKSGEIEYVKHSDWKIDETPYHKVECMNKNYFNRPIYKIY
ncbi:hypothetical protein U9K52_09695 [Chryseobacterium sp. MHB01]|uniref:hypothetical protein n=1 Tax=Chryseobacterium sp. MHB01 TaxID=3109433 RepID=UPI002AFF44EB|nr:hypothetical protein [Chryseobacterium sp. MHB01]MEA1849184.1 hypothetical protein [Chryseobacterium sp. MHB01]